jgi:hypothetical protein
MPNGIRTILWYGVAILIAMFCFKNAALVGSLLSAIGTAISTILRTTVIPILSGL